MFELELFPSEQDLSRQDKPNGCCKDIDRRCEPKWDRRKRESEYRKNRTNQQTAG